MLVNPRGKGVKDSMVETLPLFEAPDIADIGGPEPEGCWVLGLVGCWDGSGCGIGVVCNQGGYNC